MGIFLTAEWRHLVMLNYEIDPAVLRPLVPRGTELDAWNGRTTISMVGFMFQKTRVFGVPIPGHVNFEEVNLRFYVRRQTAEGILRGVVFIKELVPRWAIAKVARAVYNENYQALPMRHRLLQHAADPDQLHDMPIQLAYQWRHQGRWQGMEVTAREPAQPLTKDTEAEFITEHYWGYVTQRDGSTVAYQVEHPRWRVRRVDDYQFDCDVAALYGALPLSNRCARRLRRLLSRPDHPSWYTGDVACPWMTAHPWLFSLRHSRSGMLDNRFEWLCMPRWIYPMSWA